MFRIVRERLAIELDEIDVGPPVAVGKAGGVRDDRRAILREILRDLVELALAQAEQLGELIADGVLAVAAVGTSPTRTWAPEWRSPARRRAAASRSGTMPRFGSARSTSPSSAVARIASPASRAICAARRRSAAASLASTVFARSTSAA